MSDQSSLEQLLALSSHLASEPLIERLANLLVRANPESQPETLAQRLRAPLEARVIAKHACVASHVELKPGALIGALAGPPMRQLAVLRRVLRLRRFEQLAEVASAVRASVGPNLPWGELDRWGDDEEEGCAQVCAAFGARHPLLYRHLARVGGEDALREEAAAALAVPSDDWNGGRQPRPLVVPWAYESVVRAAAGASFWALAENLIDASVLDPAAHLRMREALVRSAIAAEDFDRAAGYLATLDQSGGDERNRGRLEALLVFGRGGRDYATFLAALPRLGCAPDDGISAVFGDAMTRRDSAVAQAALERLSTEQGFVRLDERLQMWGLDLVNLLAEQRQYADALLWSAKLFRADTHRGQHVRVGYLAALQGDLTVAHDVLGAPDVDGELARSVRPLLSAIEGRPVVIEPDLPIRERAFALLFELERLYGASPAIERDIASFSAPLFRPAARETAPGPFTVAAHALRAVGSRPDRDRDTFDAAGVPFPLYAAPASSCGRYVGLGRCAATGRDAEHCFEIDWLAATCAACGAKTHPLPSEATCTSCGAGVPAGQTQGRGGIASYEAIVAGDAGFVMATELDIIEPRNVEAAHRATGVDTALLWELLRTPPYTTWQGELWLFHCREPMVFVGERLPEELAPLELTGEDAAVVEALDPDTEGLMTFRCRRCGTHRFHIDEP